MPLNPDKSLGSISVLLPARASEKTVENAVLSVLFQIRIKIHEVLVIVEETDLFTLDALENVQDPRVRRVLVPKGTTLTDKLNVGLSKSSGELIARMDADDISLPWRMKRQLSIMKRANADVVFSTAWIFGWDLRPLPLLPQMPVPLDVHDIRLALLTSNPLVHPTMLASKNLLIKAGGYREVPAEDLDLWIRLLLQERVLVRDWAPGVLYRFAKSSVSHQGAHRKAVLQDRHLRHLREELQRKLEDRSSSRGDIQEAMLPRRSWRLRIAMFTINKNH